jgi:hypothetical protein
MPTTRRSFLKQLAAALSGLLAVTPLSGCLSDSDTQESATSEQPTQTSAPTAPATQAPAAAPTQEPLNTGPVWQPSPTIEFVEGVPAVVSVRDFVLDPDRDPLVITMKSGRLLPGITWNPSNATIGYDGRPLGAKPGTPVVVPGVTFSADDRKN